MRFFKLNISNEESIRSLEYFHPIPVSLLQVFFRLQIWLAACVRMTPPPLQTKPTPAPQGQPYLSDTNSDFLYIFVQNFAQQPYLMKLSYDFRHNWHYTSMTAFFIVDINLLLEYNFEIHWIYLVHITSKVFAQMHSWLWKSPQIFPMCSSLSIEPPHENYHLQTNQRMLASQRQMASVAAKVGLIIIIIIITPQKRPILISKYYKRQSKSDENVLPHLTLMMMKMTILFISDASPHLCRWQTRQENWRARCFSSSSSSY